MTLMTGAEFFDYLGKRVEAAKTKQVPAFYIFENGTDNTQDGKPVGAAFAHKKGKGFTFLIAGKRYAAFPPKAKT